MKHEYRVQFKNYVRELWRVYSNKYSVTSYAQEGEDLVLKRIFGDKKDGFYVDVGAHHPFRFSNTYLFYKNGWHGINIDAMPGSMRLFSKFRSRDVNLEDAVSDVHQELTYYVFNELALNSFDKALSLERLKNQRYKIQKEIKINTVTLDSIIKKNISIGQKIDFLSVDVEGYDLNVLRSNDWESMRPTYVIVEILNIYDFDDLQKNDVFCFLVSKNYKLLTKLVNSCIFQSCE